MEDKILALIVFAIFMSVVLAVVIAVGYKLYQKKQIQRKEPTVGGQYPASFRNTKDPTGKTYVL